MSWMNLSVELEPHIRKGDIVYCINQVTNAIKSLPDSPFHQIIELHFTNKPKKVAQYFKKFIKQENRRFPIKAIYTETNGFDINPDRWFFDLFAFDSYGGHEDYDWLSDWKSGDYPSMTLTGMEKLQQVYASESFYKNEYDDASGYCSFMVVLRFQQLIGESVALLKGANFPILATSHDYDFMYEYNPNSEQGHAH